MEPMLIDGQRVRTEKAIPVRLPYDGSLVGEVSEASPQHVDDAVEAASRAASKMRELSRDERAQILLRTRTALIAAKDEFARLISSESGKPLREAEAEVDRSAYTLLFSAEEAHRLCGEEVPLDASPKGKGHMAIAIREPLGVIAAISPFNFPLNLSVHKIGPALAAGNAVVHKPATATPLSALRLAQLFLEVGLPPGALNVITGPGTSIGERLVSHPDVAMVTFTGSAAVGMRLRNNARLKRVTLELGNNSGVIVCADADIAGTAAQCVPGSYAHSGQVCISVQRILIEEKVFEPFVDAFVAEAAKLRIGNPLTEGTDVSSLITETEAKRVEQWIAEAESAGARRIAGGMRRGATITPTVLAQVPQTQPIYRKEAFGPVVCLNSFRSLDEAVSMLNDTEYGLQASIFTRDLQAAFNTARRAQVGGFLINDVPQFRVDQMPYGGVKGSGTGREGPKYAIEEMTELKLITWRV
jgi:acyl-CoA reductase-like NAD-dependent aldehyde dehydrogenase